MAMFTSGNTIGRRYSLRGYAEVRDRLSRAIAQVPKQVMRSAKAEFEIEKRESMKRTPVLTGKLRASHKVTEPEFAPGRSIRISITVGGDDINYAIRVHEDLTMNHPRGGQAKFLEFTLNESSKFIAARIARGVDLRRSE